MYPHARSLFSFPNGCSGQITLSAAMRCAYLKATHGHCDLRCWYDDDDHDDDDDGDDDTKELPSSVSDCMTSCCRAFAELASSTHRFRSIRKCLFLCGLHRKGLRQQHHSCHGMRPQKRSTLLVASARALGSESSHRSDRSQRSMRQRPTWRRRRQRKSRRRILERRFPFQCLFHHEQHRVRRKRYRRDQRARAHASDRVLAEGLTQKKPMIAGYGTGRGTGGRHRSEASAPVRRVCSARSMRRCDGPPGTPDHSRVTPVRAARLHGTQRGSVACGIVECE